MGASGGINGGKAGFDVNKASAGALQQGMQATQKGLNFNPMQIKAQKYNPYRVGSSQINRFMNPYEDQVVQQSMRDIGDAQQQALNLQGMQADRANAFGGSRHGIAEAETRLGYGQQMADTSNLMRQQGFNTALGAAQQDASTINEARMYGAQQRASAQAQNLAAQQAAMQTRLGAGQQLAGMGQQGFGISQAIQNQQMQQGLLQQGMQQNLIDAGKAQYGGYTNAPMQSLNTMLAALSGAQSGAPQTATQSYNPGLLSYLQSAAKMFPRGQ